MISFEEYEYKYSLFLAENELFCSTVDSILEATNIEYLNEAFSQSINNYISKVSKSTQSAWDRFKSSIFNEKTKKYLEDIAPIIKNGTSTFNIDNFPNYDMNKFKTIKLVEFDYERMKDNLRNEKDFIFGYYRNLTNGFGDKKPNIYKAIEKSIITSRGRKFCDKKFIIGIYNFCAKGYLEYRTAIENDLKILNRSSTNITNSVNGVISTKQESYNIVQDMILEASVMSSIDRNKNKMTFTDNNGEKTISNNKSAKKEEGNFSKAVNVYMKVSTDIISAKMKILNNIYFRDYMEILEHYVDLEKHKSKKSIGQKINNQVKI